MHIKRITKRLKSVLNKTSVNNDFINTLYRRNYQLLYNYLYLVCEDGFYGNMCNISCGRCKNGQACDKHNGSCYDGCVANFQQPKCEGNCYDHSIFEK